MVKDINGLGNYTSPKTVTEQEPGKTAAKSSPAASEKESTAINDEVQLSSSAKNLQSLADKANSLPEINIERVERIKAALESGQYKIDDLVLADKILQSETLLDS